MHATHGSDRRATSRSTPSAPRWADSACSTRQRAGGTVRHPARQPAADRAARHLRAQRSELGVPAQRVRGRAGTRARQGRARRAAFAAADHRLTRRGNRRLRARRARVASGIWQNCCQILDRRAARARRPPGTPRCASFHALLHAPLLHFVAGGALLFLLTRAVHSEDAAPTAVPVVVTAADVAQLRRAYTAETGSSRASATRRRSSTPRSTRSCCSGEAVARGLDRHDRSVRTWLVEQMQILTEDPNAPQAQSEEQLYQRALELGLDKHDLVVRRILIRVRLLAGRVEDGEASDADLRDWYGAARGRRAAVARDLLARLPRRRRPRSGRRSTRSASSRRCASAVRRRATPCARATRSRCRRISSAVAAAARQGLRRAVRAAGARESGRRVERTVRIAPTVCTWCSSKAGVGHAATVRRRARTRARVVARGRARKRLKSLLRGLRARYPLEVDSGRVAREGEPAK